MKINVLMDCHRPIPPVDKSDSFAAWSNLFRHLADKGHELHCFARAWPGHRVEENAGLLRFHRSGGFDPKERPLNAMLTQYVWCARHIIRLRKADVLLWFTPVFPPFFPLGFTGKGKVVLCHHAEPGNTPDRHAVRRASRMFVIGEAPSMPELLAGKTVSFPFPIDCSSVSPKKRPLLRHEKAPISYWFRPGKEHELALFLDAGRALLADKTLPPWKLRIGQIAPGKTDLTNVFASLPGEILEKIDRFASGQIEWKLLSHGTDAMASWIDGTEIFCWPGHDTVEDADLLPLKLAMASGATPVASYRKAFQGILRSGENSFLFQVDSESALDELSSILKSLLVEIPLRRWIGEKAAEDARIWDYNTVADAMIEEFKRL